MTDQVDSYMLCSQMDLSRTNNFQSSLSFGKALDDKRGSNKETQISSHVSFQSSSKFFPKKISLKKIFNEYLTDPLSTYTLKLQNSSKFSEEVDYLALKTINQNFGQYTTSMEQNSFQDQMDGKPLQNSQISPPKMKFIKISSILRIIQQKRVQKNGLNQQYIYKGLQNDLLNAQVEDQSIGKVSFDKNNFDSLGQETNQKPQSEVFLELESNISNKGSQIGEMLNFFNKKSQKKIYRKQCLSPVCQNPQKRALKINNSDAKSPISSKKYYGTVSGLEFSKKLRKKTFNPKKIDLGISINAFNVVG